MIKNEWNKINFGDSPMAAWQNKIRLLRKFLRGAHNISSAHKNEKESLLQLIDSLDKKAESVPLTTSEKEMMREANEKVLKLCRDKESKWDQRAKVKHIQERGNNTNIFIL
jgi:hypothetical protein